MIQKTDQKALRKASTPTLMGVAALSALVGFGAVYATLGRTYTGEGGSVGAAPKVNSAGRDGEQAASAAKGLNAGAMTAFVFKKAPEELPDVSFVDAGGTPRTLKDFRGRTVLLNLWATWCAPCREEMPSLDRLQKELGSDGFEVVALAVDRGGIEGAKKFLDEIKVANLKLYADPTTRSATTLKAIGMPTTILIDPEGREVGRLPGPAVWDSGEARHLVEASLR